MVLGDITKRVNNQDNKVDETDREISNITGETGGRKLREKPPQLMIIKDANSPAPPAIPTPLGSPLTPMGTPTFNATPTAQQQELYNRLRLRNGMSEMTGVPSLVSQRSLSLTHEGLVRSMSLDRAVTPTTVSPHIAYMPTPMPHPHASMVGGCPGAPIKPGHPSIVGTFAQTPVTPGGHALARQLSFSTASTPVTSPTLGGTLGGYKFFPSFPNTPVSYTPTSMMFEQHTNPSPCSFLIANNNMTM